ncbi:hypothetical protein ARMGADRAFT_1036625 [Armillaria gallica]|uniref:Uncharacterized protein n=1 Tax=Armillaria gallica TaxID=47427 RepID=A0A2H3CTG1_ARMGA|nr:hypothetical protein ARMGADRAFT_1036625 [Armillaria gallica]
MNPPTNTSRVRRRPHKMQPQGPAMFTKPPLLNYLTPQQRRGVYRLRTQTHGLAQRMLNLSYTQTTQWAPGPLMTPLNDTTSGINLSPYSTYPTSLLNQTPYHPTWSGESWNYQKLAHRCPSDPFNPEGSTTSGMPSPQSTGKSLNSTKQRHGSSEGEMSRADSSGDTEVLERMWTSTSPLNEGIPSWEDTMMATDPIWMGDPFEGFHYNEKTFGRGFLSSQTAEEYLKLPQPLLDSPSNLQHPGIYSGPWTSRLFMGASNKQMGEGSGGAVPEPTTEERLQQAHNQITQMHAQQDQLMEELAKIKKEGKQPDCS